MQLNGKTHSFAHLLLQGQSDTRRGRWRDMMCGKDRQLRPDSGLKTTEERLPWAKIVLLEEPIDEMR